MDKQLQVAEADDFVQVCARIGLGDSDSMIVTFTTVDGTAQGNNYCQLLCMDQYRHDEVHCLV